MIPPNLYGEAFALAAASNRPTVYETHYVALAQMLGCELWTADLALLNALADTAPYVRAIGHY